MNAKRKSSPPRKASDEKMQEESNGVAADVVGMGTCTVNYHALVPETGFMKTKRISQGLEVSLGGATAQRHLARRRLPRAGSEGRRSVGPAADSRSAR